LAFFPEGKGRGVLQIHAYQKTEQGNIMIASVQILLIEDNDDHAQIITRHIREAQKSEIHLVRENCLSLGLQRLSSHTFDLILLDLGLPDGDRHVTLSRALQAAPHVPIVVLSSIDDRQLALKTVSDGAEDYIYKAELNSKMLLRSIFAAIERKRLQKELKTKIQELNESHRKKDEFLAALSHELRTPLNAIIGFVDLLKTTDPKSPDFLRALEVIERNAWAECQLVSDILEMSQIITGKMKLDKRKFNLQELIESVTDSMFFATQAKNIRVHMKMSCSVSDFVGDERRVRQIIWNILSNAVKFTEQRGFINLELLYVDGSYEIRIQDNGIGISSEALPHIFERFWQVDASITRVQSGLGIGLSIVQGLVEQHGGSIQVSSEGIGKGSLFTVRLPMKIDPETIGDTDSPSQFRRIRSPVSKGSAELPRPGF